MILVLGLPYSEHLGATGGAYSLGCWLTVLHSDGFGVFHFPFGTALHAVCLHCLPPFPLFVGLVARINYSCGNVNSYKGQNA